MIMDLNMTAWAAALFSYKHSAAGVSPQDTLKLDNSQTPLQYSFFPSTIGVSLNYDAAQSSSGTVQYV